MSNLQREWAKSKLGLASQVPVMEELKEEGEQDGEPLADLSEHIDDDSSSASSVSSSGTIIPTLSQKLFARPLGVARGRTLEPIPWTTYFERELYLECDELPGLRFHAYLTSPVGNGPLFVAHHGAGSSGLSFAVVSSEIRKRLPTAGILAVDCRGHGSTVSPEGSELDLRLATLARDLYFVIQLTKEKMGWPNLPPVILVGHSLGGAVVTELAHAGTLGTLLLAYAVLDIVEGSAMEALKSMQTYLSIRPVGFTSIETAIEWHVRSRTIRNSVSARTSVSALLTRDDTIDASHPWRWRTNLSTTQPFWEDWFAGLSKKFLASKGGKLLLLAGTDRLDTEMTIGQMQGKYALQVFADAGHFIHEDLPEQTATSLCDFFRRNDRSTLVLPPKVSDLLKQGKKV
ncbi:putative carboxyl methyl esterase [Claviceps maximensis]|nr:putative carboxyl methyl esterase [Claviceps maximensis]